MRIGLFIPCYIDAFFPEVGIATLELLERFGHEVDYPRDQTCCGQPMANSGFNAECADTEALFVRNFSGFDYVVSPSGSCVHHVRDNFDADRADRRGARRFARGPSSWSSFCTTSRRSTRFPGPDFRIGSACTTVAARCAGLSTRFPRNCTSRSFPSPSTCSPRSRASSSSRPARPDECCGFGGTFSVFEEVVSTKMGYDKVSDHAQAGAEYIVSADSSCLMHQQGCAERIGVPMKFIHIAQILNGASA